ICGDRPRSTSDRLREDFRPVASEHPARLVVALQGIATPEDRLFGSVLRSPGDRTDRELAHSPALRRAAAPPRHEWSPRTPTDRPWKKSPEPPNEAPDRLRAPSS